MSFFDDDGEVTAPPEPRPRRRTSRSRTRLQRFAVLAAIIFVIVLVLTLSIRSCQSNRKKDAYSTYMAGVQTVVDDSAAITKQIVAKSMELVSRTGPPVKCVARDILWNLPPGRPPPSPPLHGRGERINE